MARSRQNVNESAIVDAFTCGPGSGNPAGLVWLDKAVHSTRWMLDIAKAVGASETAFLVRRSDDEWDLRWFTPKVEVDLCGHATLAAAHWLQEKGAVGEPEIVFHTRSGRLVATACDDGRIALDFPRVPVLPSSAMQGWQGALPGIGASWVGTTAGAEPLHRKALVLTDADDLRRVAPDFSEMAKLSVGGWIVTAPSDVPGSDILSRYFAPVAGVDEDPVTGSAHCTLSEFWGPRLGVDRLRAKQVSERGGEMEVVRGNGRVRLIGRATTVGSRAIPA